MLDALSLDLTPVVAEQPDPLLFATVSGAHLYGFPSRDSDIDLRGAHLLPAQDLLGLREPEETRTRMWDRDDVEMDLVTHDLRKFVRLMLKHNGYVLEQLLSPLVVHDAGARGADRAVPGRADLPPRPPLPRVRGHPVAALREGRRTQAAALRVPGAAHRHPPHAVGRGTGAPADPAGRGAAGAPVPRRPDRGQGGRRARGYEGPALGTVRQDFEVLHAVLDATRAASALPEQGSAYDALDAFVVRRRTLRG